MVNKFGSVKYKIIIAFVIISSIVGIIIYKSNSAMYINLPHQIPASISEKFIVGYTLNKELECEKTLREPMGLVAANDMLIVSDSGNNRVLFLDYEGNIIKTIGKTGNGNGEFIKPTGLTIYNNKIYVVDSGNYRIQVFNINGDFIDKIEINVEKYSSSHDFLNGIAVSDNNYIYISVYTGYTFGAKIIAITPDGKTKVINKQFEGHLAKVDNRVIFVSEMELIKKGEDYAATTGRNFMLEISDGKVLNLIELPYRYQPSGIFYNHGELVMVSASRASINTFDMNGKYKETLFKGDWIMLNGMAALTMDEDGNMFVCNKKKNVIYKFSKPENKE